MFIYDVVFYLVFKEIKKIQAAVMNLTCRTVHCNIFL